MIIEVTDLHLRDLQFLVTRADGRLVDFSQLVTDYTWMDHVNVAGAEVSITAEGLPELVNQIGMEGTTAAVKATVPNVIDGRMEHREIWRGFFEEVVNERTAESVTRQITAYDAGKLLATDEEDYVFRDATLSGIVNRVATDFSIPVGEVETTSTVLGNIVCRGESLWDLFQKGVQRHQDITGETFRILFREGRISMFRMAQTDRWWIFEVGRSIHNLRQTRSIAEMENRIRVYGQIEDELTKPEVEATVESVQSQGIFGLRQKVEYVSTADDREVILDIAQRRINRNSIPEETIEISGWAIPLLRAGEAVEAIDVDMGVSGIYFVESLEVTFNSDSAEGVAQCRRAPVDPGLWMNQLVVA